MSSTGSANLEGCSGLKADLGDQFVTAEEDLAPERLDAGNALTDGILAQALKCAPGGNQDVFCPCGT